MLMEVDKNMYSNGELTVVYDPKKCANAGLCCAGLSEVFRNSVIPWIDLDGASSEAVIPALGRSAMDDSEPPTVSNEIEPPRARRK